MQLSRKYPILLFLLAFGLAFEFHVVLCYIGRPGAETSAKWGKLFPRAAAELTVRELHHHVGQSVGCVCRQPLLGTILPRQTRPQLGSCLQWVVRLAVRSPALLSKAQAIYSPYCVSKDILFYMLSSRLPFALQKDSMCCLTRSQTIKSQRTVLEDVFMFPDSCRTLWRWEEALSIECCALPPETSLLFCRPQHQSFCDFYLSKIPIVQSAFRHFRGKFSVLGTEIRHAYH